MFWEFLISENSKRERLNKSMMTAFTRRIPFELDAVSMGNSGESVALRFVRDRQDFDFDGMDGCSSQRIRIWKLKFIHPKANLCFETLTNRKSERSAQNDC